MVGEGSWMSTGEIEAGVEVEVEVLVEVGPKEQHNHCKIPALGLQGKAGSHMGTLVKGG